MQLTNLSILASLAVGALALPRAHNHVVHEKRNMGSSWVPREDVRPHGKVKLPMRIGLTQTNLHLGHDLLMGVSDPASKKYGEHLSLTEVCVPLVSHKILIHSFFQDCEHLCSCSGIHRCRRGLAYSLGN